MNIPSLKFPVIIILITIFFVITGFPVTCLFPQETTDDDIKAALVFKFPIYVRWPVQVMNDKTEYFECCVLGNDPLSDILIQFNGEKIMQKTIRVKQISGIESIENCHLLFISSSKKKNLFEILKTAKEKHILTIGDMKDFAQNGGIINFIRKKDSVHFEINPEAGKRAGLEISSKLLRLAEIVDEKQARE